MDMEGVVLVGFIVLLVYQPLTYNVMYTLSPPPHIPKGKR